MWIPLASTDNNAGVLTATTDHFTEFAVLLTLPTTCDIAPGEGAPDTVKAAFEAAYAAQEGLGCATGPAALRDGAYRQVFIDDNELIYNQTNGQAYHLTAFMVAAYDAAGGPDGFLGLPIQNYRDAENAPARYADDGADFTNAQMLLFERGFVGFNSKANAWQSARHFPLACEVSATVIYKDSGERTPPTDEYPEGQVIFKKHITVSFGGLPNPGDLAAGDSWLQAEVQIANITQGNGPDSTVQPENGVFRLDTGTTLFELDDEIAVRAELTRASDSRVGYATKEWLKGGESLAVSAGPGTHTLATCAGAGLPGGGGYLPPTDSTPPVIEEPTLFQNGTGAVAVKAKITDNVSVASATLNIDGTDYPMAPRGNDFYEGVVYNLKQGKHSAFITALDPAGNPGRWPESGARVFEIELSGFYGVIPWQGYSPDPVNTMLGNYIYEYTDLALSSPGPDLVIKRFYNAQSSLVGLFGLGWTTVLDTHIQVIDNLLMQGAQVRYPDGRTVNFPAEGDGFGRPDWVFDRLERSGAGFLLTTAANARYEFNESGRLTRVSDETGNAIELSYAGDQLSEARAASGQRITFAADAAGRITAMQVVGGPLTAYAYDDGGRLLTVTDGTGATVTYRYDDDHGLVELQTPQGHDFVAEQTFDDQGRVVFQRIGDNFINTFAYDDDQRTTVMGDTYGNTITYRYDQDGRLIEQIDAHGNSERYEYNADNQRTAITDRNGHTTRHTYSEAGDLVATVDALGNVTTNVYDDQHHLISTTDALGRTTTHEYDAQGRRVATVDALGQRTEWRFNDRGQVVAQTSPRGFTTAHEYDDQGRLTLTRDVLGHEKRFEYDALGRLAREIDQRGNATSFAYDENGNLLARTDALGHVTSYVYDANNNRIRETDANGNVTEYGYTTLDNLATTLAADGGLTTVIYDDMNNRIGERDPLGNTTRWGLDATYRVISETNALGHTIGYAYDAAGNRVRETDARGFATVHEYDALGRLVKTVDALGGTISFAYDAAGNRVQETAPNGATTTYEYDALNRVIAQTDALGHVSRTEYDADGNRIREIDALGNVTTHEYDALGQLIKTVDALGGATSFAYDAAGNQTAVTDALGFTSRTEYDALNRKTKQIDALGNATSYAYDAAGNLTTATNPLGFVTSTEYDVLNRPVVTIDALGGRTSTVYNLAGWKISETNTNNHTTRFTHDVLGQVIAVTDPLGFTVGTSYDASGNPTKIVDQAGGATLMEYDGLSRLIAQINALGHITRFGYDITGNQIERVDALGFITSYGYDLLGRRISETNALGHTTHYDYDELGRQVRTKAANGTVTSKAYDALGRLVRETDAVGHVTTASYDAVGNLISATDARGFITTRSYDSLRRLTSIADSLGPRSEQRYDAAGNLILIKDGNGHATSYAYDALGRRISEIDPTGDTTTMAYDAVGNLVAVTDGNGYTAIMAYDARNQLIKQTNALGHATSYTYDGVGRKVRITDTIGVVTCNYYDAVGQLRAVILNCRLVALAGPDTNVITQYGYDAVGNRISVTDPNGHTSRFTPDALGQLVRETDPLGNSITFEYDVVGNQIKRVNADGAVVHSVYDFDGLLLQTRYPDGSTVTRSYDANHNPLSIHDRSGRTDRAYDERNRMISETTSRGTVASAYDLADNRISLSYADQRVVRYTYAEDNTLQTVTNPDGSQTTYERDGIDQVVSQQNGNNTRTINSYDAVNRLLSTATSQISGNKLISSASYQYNSVDQRTQATFVYRTGQPKTVIETYTYDALRRLVGQTDNSGTKTQYRFDAAGNRLAWLSSDNPATPRPNDAVDLAYAYDAADALVRIDDRAGETTTLYRYDANGNRLETLTGREGTAYRYDAEHRLLSVQAFTINGSGKRIEHEIATMLYDGDGRRVAKAEDHKVGGGGIQTTTYAYDGLDQIAVNETWHPQHQNLYRAEGGRILTLDGFSGGNDGQDYWFAQDGLGSTQALSKSDGQAAHSYQYDAYGQIKPENSSNFGPHNTFTFSGQEYDTFIGLYHYHARAYDAATGTWLTRDPYRGTQDDPQSLHRYGYVKGNPINLIDIYGYAAQGGTYGKPCQLASAVFDIGSNFFLDFAKKVTGRDLVADLRDIECDAEPGDINGFFKRLANKKSLVRRSLLPDGARNLKVLNKDLNPILDLDTNFEVVTDINLSADGIDASMCVNAGMGLEVGLTLPSATYPVALDIYGTASGEVQGCITYNHNPDKPWHQNFDIKAEASASIGLGLRAYAVLDIYIAGGRVGIRMEAKTTWNWQWSLSEGADEVQPSMGLEFAAFYGTKSFWSGRKWVDKDIFTLSAEIPLQFR